MSPRSTPTSLLETRSDSRVPLERSQERLPGRLQNALATKSLSPVKILPMKNRKFPSNFPATRGEFEHLTSTYTFSFDPAFFRFLALTGSIHSSCVSAEERYEALMASYDVPISGDTAAKRETLRIFLGIPSGPLEKK